MDVSQKTSWEANLTSYLDEIPFQNIGKGNQNILKILLALGKKKAKNSDIILIEEPENHLSFSTMNLLIGLISEKCNGKQLVITTHSTFVLNKLGIEKVILLGSKSQASLKDLSPETQRYFKKLPGYDTLRLILAKKSILVEGPSDELFVQKAYYQQHHKLPIETGIDVISVRGLSFKRFLEIAKFLGKEVSVVTDNDGNYVDKVEKKYEEYLNVPHIKICYDKDNDCKTLEPQIVKVNELALLNATLERNEKTKEDMIRYMAENKAESALKIFESANEFIIPDYIKNAIN
jgi:predicted ATP-dependent endonuclease of OLD family